MQHTRNTDAENAVRRDGDDPRARAERLLATLQWAPPLGIRAAEALRSLRPEQNGRAAASVLQRDPALAVRVLKIANAPLYGASGRIDSLERAVVMLGTTALSGIALMASLDGTLHTTQGHDSKLGAVLRQRSLDAAAHARSLALRFAPAAADAALSAALLHELGIMVMLRIDAVRTRGLHAAAGAAGDRDADDGCCARERAAFGTDHAHLGAALLRRWHLPETVAAAVEGHHAAQAADTPLTAIVHLATAAAASRSAGPPAFAPDERLLEVLGATAAEVQAIASHATAAELAARVA